MQELPDPWLVVSVLKPLAGQSWTSQAHVGVPIPKIFEVKVVTGYLLLPFPMDSWLQTKERVIDSPQISVLFLHSKNNAFTLRSCAPLTIRIFLFPFIQQTFTPMDAIWAKGKVGIPGSLHSRHTGTPLAGSTVWNPRCPFTVSRHSLKAQHWVCDHKLQQNSPHYYEPLLLHTKRLAVHDLWDYSDFPFLQCAIKLSII